MKAVVTGGAGFIGSHLVRELHAIGFEVVVIDDLSAGQKQVQFDEKKIHHVKIDLSDERNIPLIEELLDDSLKIFHLAADSKADLKNIKMTKNLLDSVKGTTKKIIFTSTSDVYSQSLIAPISEVDILEPKNLFAFEKMACEELLSLYSRTCGVQAVTLRLFDVYGPGDNTSEISNLLDWHMRDEPLFVSGNGLQTNDFIHVDDVVNALLTISGLTYWSGNIFNIGSGEELNMNEIAKLVDEKNIEHYGEYNGPMRRIADIEAATDMLGWKPQQAIKDVLPEMSRRTSQ